METVAESRDPALAEDLLRFVMSMQDKEMIATMLYTCYELIKPDVAMEIGWRCGLQEFVMPYFIQFVRDLSTRVEKVQKSTDDIKKKEEVKAEEEANRPLDLDMHFMFPGMRDPMGGMGAAPLSIMPAAGSMPGMGMGGFSAGPAGFGGGMSAFQTAPTGLGSFGTMNGMQSGFNTQQRF
jgi:clathrin heavy chain